MSPDKNPKAMHDKDKKHDMHSTSKDREAKAMHDKDRDKKTTPSSNKPGSTKR